MRNITGFLLPAAMMAAASLATPPGIASAGDEDLSFELVLDVGLVYGYQVGDFAIEGAIQDEGSAFGEFVTMPDGTQSFQLMLSGENTDWSLDIYDVQGQIGPGFSVIFSSDFFTLVGDAGTYAGVMGSGTASGYTYYSDGTSWGYPGNRQNWQLSGELIAPLPPPPPSPTPELAIDDVSIVEGNRGTRNATFTVALSPASEDTITVEYVTEDGTARVSKRDYYAASGVLTFEPGQTTASIAVKVRGDRKREPDETFFVYLGNPVGAVLADDEGIGTILNDD
jgi:hypothetical protein